MRTHTLFLVALIAGGNVAASECVLDGGGVALVPCDIDAGVDPGLSTSVDLVFYNSTLAEKNYALFTGDPDCTSPVAVPWLAPNFGEVTVPAKASATYAVQLDSGGLAPGTWRAVLCVTSTPTQAVPVTFRVGDRVFADGFDADGNA